MATPIPPVDEGNALLAEGPAQCTVALVPTPAGQRMVLTVRTSSATVSVLLGQADAKAWGAQITAQAAQMSAAGLIVSGGAPLLNGNGAQP
jgi:hypothetical protein